MKNLLLLTLFSLVSCVICQAQNTKKDNQTIIASNATVEIVTKDCNNLNWEEYQKTLTDVEIRDVKKFIIRIQRDGVSEKGLPTELEVMVKGRNPAKVLRRAKRWCKRIS